MDSFMDICIQDGKLTEAGERASALVYEHITGKCWHQFIGDGIMKYMAGSYSHICNKCNQEFHSRSCTMFDANPPLATSLDAWRPLWKAMGDELMAELFGMRVTNSHLLDPMWWLEASLRACGLYEKWRAGNEQL